MEVVVEVGERESANTNLCCARVRVRESESAVSKEFALSTG